MQIEIPESRHSDEKTSGETCSDDSFFRQSSTATIVYSRVGKHMMLKRLLGYVRQYEVHENPFF
jgi:hypothetical protein